MVEAVTVKALTLVILVGPKLNVRQGYGEVVLDLVDTHPFTILVVDCHATDLKTRKMVRVLRSFGVATMMLGTGPSDFFQKNAHGRIFLGAWTGEFSSKLDWDDLAVGTNLLEHCRTSARSNEVLGTPSYVLPQHAFSCLEVLNWERPKGCILDGLHVMVHLVVCITHWLY